MNRKQKGNRMELEVKRIHEEKGYMCEKVRNTPYHHGDFFGAADILALNTKHLKLIAVTSKHHKAKAIQKLKLPFKRCPKFIVREAWLYGSGKEWEVVNV